MKLRNKKTGEIVYATMMASYGGGELQIRYYPVNNAESTHLKEYRSISELNEEWEDVPEEPKGYWCITGRGNLHYLQDMTDENDKDHRQIGNYFETKEEAEKAVENLKAWKRLKEKGFEITDWTVADGYELRLFGHYSRAGIKDDLDLLFGGEE